MKHLLILVGLLVLGSACRDANSSFSSITSEGEVQGVPIEDVTLLERMELAPHASSYHGEREIHFYVQGAEGRVDRLSYVEAVVSDGVGRFAVVPLEVIRPDLSPERLELFRMIQRSREEFFFNHRDFRIRDMDLFQANYNVVVMESEFDLLGRRAMRLLVRPNRGKSGHYEVEVDLDSGLVLGHREFDPSGRLVSELAFTELIVGPLPPAYSEVVRRHEPNWEPAAAGDPFERGQISAPRVPPVGYQLIERRIVTDPQGERWYQLIYADGVEQLFMLFALDGSDTSRVTSADEVVVYGHGAWTILEGRVRAQRVIVLGKVPQDDLLWTLESCL